MVKEIKMGKCHYPKSFDFEGLIGNGQHPKGFTAQTVNGTAHAGNCPGWNRDMRFEWPEVPATGVWDNANRSGE
jgi:hypothetical protein